MRLLFTVFISLFVLQPVLAQQVMDIADARQESEDATVTIAGRITATEFGAPVYMQDATAGIAIYDPGSDIDNVAVGDSVQLTGQITEFNNLLEIDNLSDVQIFDVASRIPAPTTVTISQVGESYEGQLLRIEQVTFSDSGVFGQSSANYQISDPTGSMELRVEDETNIPSATIPDEAVTIVGVLGQYRDNYQMLPRSVDDIGIEEQTIPGSDVPFSETFEVVTWNIEWFSSSSNGPDDDALQEQNVQAVIDSIGADVYAFQEVSDETAFMNMMDALPEYRGFVVPGGGSQQLAYAYRVDVVDSVTSDFLKDSWEENSTNFNPFAGREPYEFVVDVTIGEHSLEGIRLVNLHMKATSERDSYLRRKDDSRQLKEFLDDFRFDDRLIILGDYNDELENSTYNNEPSPYDNFLSDSDNYTFTTKRLEEQGFSSYAFSQPSFLDHIMISNELYGVHFDSTTQVVNPDYIPSYQYETSDHYPVLTRFHVDPASPTENRITTTVPNGIKLLQNYPNPFNPSTTLRFALNHPQKVTLSVYDVMGRKVETVTNQRYAAGSHSLTFDASDLASGVYIYQLQTEVGVLQKTMTLIK